MAIKIPAIVTRSLRYLVAKWNWAVDERPNEVLPRELIGLALIATGVSAVAGWYLDEHRFRGYDITINVLASLVVLGPGLVITNVIARNWQEHRKEEHLLNRLRVPVIELIAYLTRGMPEAIQELSKWAPTLTARWDGEDIDDVLGSLHGLQEVLQAMDAVLVYAPDDPELRVEISNALWTPADFFYAALRRQVARLAKHCDADLMSERLEYLKQCNDAMEEYVGAGDTMGDTTFQRLYTGSTRVVVSAMLDLVMAVTEEIPRVKEPVR